MKRQRIIKPTAKNDGVLEIERKREREKDLLNEALNLRGSHEMSEIEVDDDLVSALHRSIQPLHLLLLLLRPLLHPLFPQAPPRLYQLRSLLLRDARQSLLPLLPLPLRVFLLLPLLLRFLLRLLRFVPLLLQQLLLSVLRESLWLGLRLRLWL